MTPAANTDSTFITMTKTVIVALVINFIMGMTAWVLDARYYVKREEVKAIYGEMMVVDKLKVEGLTSEFKDIKSDMRNLTNAINNLNTQIAILNSQNDREKTNNKQENKQTKRE